MSDTATLLVVYVGLAGQLDMAGLLKDHDEIGSAELKVAQLLALVKGFAHLHRDDY